MRKCTTQMATCVPVCQTERQNSPHLVVETEAKQSSNQPCRCSRSGRQTRTPPSRPPRPRRLVVCLLHRFQIPSPLLYCTCSAFPLPRARVSAAARWVGLGCTVVSRGTDRIDGGGVERGGRGDRVAGAERPGDPPRRQAGGLDARGRARRRRAEARGRDEERRDGARRGGRPGEGARRERAAGPLPRRPEEAAVRR
ncbi:hypothetical protein EE612_025624 [Oryza sativa]|nr:hypothetical protein EE612_025624 [Oryza sativa]